MIERKGFIIFACIFTFVVGYYTGGILAIRAFNNMMNEQYTCIPK